jgi:predicted RNA-binding protein YlqC (UPF0109 family)
MQSFLEFVVRHLVDHPAEATVSKVQGGEDSRGGILYELRVARGDVGKIVGKHGQTIEAIRSLAAASAARYSERVRVEIVEDCPETLSNSDTSDQVGGAESPGKV